MQICQEDALLDFTHVITTHLALRVQELNVQGDLIDIPRGGRGGGGRGVGRGRGGLGDVVCMWGRYDSLCGGFLTEDSLSKRDFSGIFDLPISQTAKQAKLSRTKVNMRLDKFGGAGGRPARVSVGGGSHRLTQCEPGPGPAIMLV